MNEKRIWEDYMIAAMADLMTDAWMTRRMIDGTRCDVLNERDIKAIEWREPRLDHVTDKCRVTQYDGKIFVYTGRRVVTVAENQRWMSLTQLLRIGKKTVREIIEKNYLPNEVIL